MLRGKETKRRQVQNMDGSQKFNNIRVGCRGVLFSKLLLWEGLVMGTLVLGRYFFLTPHLRILCTQLLVYQVVSE